MQTSDEYRWSALMVSAQTGNESDYRQLLEELAVVIRNFLRSRFGHLDIVEDCVQESLIAIHQARHTYDPDRAFRAWLFAIVRNRAIDVLRHQRTRKRAVEQFTTEQEVLSQPEQQSGPEREILVGRLLESLPKQHKEVVILTRVIGYSMAEAAEKLGITEGAVKVRVHRATRELQRSLGREHL